MPRCGVVERWQDLLWGYAITGARMRILVLNSEIPFPPITGAQTRTYQLLKGICVEHDVTLVGFSWDSHDSSNHCSLPLTIRTVPWVRPEPYREMHEGSPLVSQAAYRHLAFENTEPWFASYYSSTAMERCLAELVSKPFDL